MPSGGGGAKGEGERGGSLMRERSDMEDEAQGDEAQGGQSVFFVLRRAYLSQDKN